MCGIAGVCRSDQQPVAQAQLEQMAHLLRHRGPDDQGLYQNGPTGLAFRRLAILDLSPAGHQPMTNEDGTLWLVFNGEIYNYRSLVKELEAAGHIFRSRSDSEAILHAYEQWGDDCVLHFDGMFAFALWDEARQRLFAARDRFGIKPFYYHTNTERFIFASEIKALLADPATPRRPNDDRLYDYLVYGYLDHTAETMFADIRQLPPAHRLVVRQGQITIQRYWDLDPDQRLDNLSDQAAIGRLRELFFDSVRLHLQSDVPIGTCLSGGLDSSAIVCAIARLLDAEGVDRAMLGERQRTFTASFDDPAFDERRFAREVIAQTGAQAYFAFPRAEELGALLPDLIWRQEEPFGSTSIVAQWCVMQMAGQQGIKVMLDGQGSDEILGGYHPFFSGLWANLLRRADFAGLSRTLAGFRGRHGVPPRILLTGALGLALPAALRSAIQVGRGRTRPAWLGPALATHPQPWLEMPAPYRDPLRRQMYQYLTTLHLPSLLHYEDRNSMAFSIEARVPFLDHRLVEFAFALPARFMLRDGETKWLLRRALADVLPPAITQRQDKMAFGTPEAAWFRTTLRPLMTEIFASARFRQRPYWNAAVVDQVFQEHQSGQADHRLLLWRWFNTELWLRRFME